MNSIRTRLTMAFLGLAVVPLLIVGLIFISQTYRVQTREAVLLQREMAAHLSAQVQSLFRELESQLQTLIFVGNIMKMQPERQKLLLSIFHSRQAGIDRLLLLDVGGRVLAGHSRVHLFKDSLFFTLKDLDLLMGPLSRGKSYFGPVRIDELSGEPLMIMAVPILALDSGKLEGMLVADVRLKSVWDLVASIRPGLKGESYITDFEDRVVAHSNPSVVLRDTRFHPTGFDGVQMGLNGQRSVLVSQIISFGDQKFRVFVEDPVSEALSLTLHTVRIVLIIVVIALLMAFGLGYLTLRWIIRPIEDIAKAARAVNTGDLSQRVDVRRRDELGDLALAFNTMTSQLQTLFGNLEQKVAQRNIELEKANKELETFAYSISHDLRAPLRHIDGFIEMLHRRIYYTLDKQNRHYMDTISNSAKRLAALIDDLLSFSRMSRSEYNIKSVDFNKLVENVLKELASDTISRHIEWRMERLPSVKGDQSMLYIVMYNLVHNALKFTRSREKAIIEIGSVSNTENEITFFVRDNGVGYDPTHADKLFGVFKRLHRQDEFEGTGIGLANVKQIVERHKGRVWAEGAPDAGATFYFTLPHGGECG